MTPIESELKGIARLSGLTEASFYDVIKPFDPLKPDADRTYYMPSDGKTRAIRYSQYAGTQTEAKQSAHAFEQDLRSLGFNCRVNSHCVTHGQSKGSWKVEVYFPR